MTETNTAAKMLRFSLKNDYNKLPVVFTAIFAVPSKHYLAQCKHVYYRNMYKVDVLMAQQ